MAGAPDWTQLAATLDGQLHVNASAPDTATLTVPCWNGLLQSDTPILQPATPAYVVSCKTKSDVVKAVSWAVRHRIKLSVKGSGHHYGGAFLVNEGMCLDLSQLRDLHLDPETRTALIEPGVTTRQLQEACAPHGLHFPGGHISDVGLSGFILGGGHGWGDTKWGAACDSVTMFEVVLPTVPAGDCSQNTDLSACVLQVTAESDAELFAGLKGAGAFLGIVVGFKVQLYPVTPSLPSITAVFPAECSQQVAALYKQLVSGLAPHCVEMSMSFIQSSGQPHAAMVVLGGLAFPEPGSDADEQRVHQTYEQIRQLLPGRRLSLHDTRMPYLEALSQLDAGWNWQHLCLYAHSMYVQADVLTPELIQALESATAGMTSPRSLILVCPAAKASEQPSAHDFRDCLCIKVYAMWPRTAGGPAVDRDTEHAAWVYKTSHVLGHQAIGLYGNEVMLDSLQQIRDCYTPTTLAKLVTVKQNTDPFGLLKDLPTL